MYKQILDFNLKQLKNIGDYITMNGTQHATENGELQDNSGRSQTKTSTIRSKEKEIMDNGRNYLSNAG